MTIEELYQAFDNVTLFTKFYIINSVGEILEWGSIYIKRSRIRFVQCLLYITNIMMEK